MDLPGLRGRPGQGVVRVANDHRRRAQGHPGTPGHLLELASRGRVRQDRPLHGADRPTVLPQPDAQDGRVPRDAAELTERHEHQVRFGTGPADEGGAEQRGHHHGPATVKRTTHAAEA